MNAYCPGCLVMYYHGARSREHLICSSPVSFHVLLHAHTSASAVLLAPPPHILIQVTLLHLLASTLAPAVVFAHPGRSPCTLVLLATEYIAYLLKTLRCLFLIYLKKDFLLTMTVKVSCDPSSVLALLSCYNSYLSWFCSSHPTLFLPGISILL